MPNLSKQRELQDELVVIGIGETDHGKIYQQMREDPNFKTDNYSMAYTAFKKALDDAGIQKDMIDGLGIGGLQSTAHTGDMLGIDPRWTYTGSAIESMMQASLALHAGLANCIAIVQGNNQRSVGTAFGGPNASGAGQWEYAYWSPWGLTSQGSLYAMMWHRYMYQTGATEADLGAVAIAERKAASMNPLAVMKKPLTLDEYKQSRYITWPLHLYDYCIINDAGHSLIVTTPDIAKNLKLKHPPVYLQNFCKADSMKDSTILKPRLKDFYHPNQKLAADQLFEVTGLNRGDVDAVEMYDSFSVHVPISLEGFGFCPIGQGAKFIQNGTIEIGGKLPVNTGGGHLSESYQQGWTQQLEAVKQLRGEAGERQVHGAKHIIYTSSDQGKIDALMYRRD